MNKISAKEKNMKLVLNSIKQWFESGKSYGPSYRDLVELSGLPIGTVYKTCHFLRDEGVVLFADGVARSITLNKKENK